MVSCFAFGFVFRSGLAPTSRCLYRRCEAAKRLVPTSRCLYRRCEAAGPVEKGGCPPLRFVLVECLPVNTDFSNAVNSKYTDNYLVVKSALASGFYFLQPLDIRLINFLPVK